MLSDYKIELLLVGSLLFSLPVLADKIHDPTRPKHFQAIMGEDGVIQLDSTRDQGIVKLQGILNKKGTKTAIIDGKLYQIGDIVGGFKISQIKLNSIVLAKGSTIKRLFVYE